MLQDFRKFAMRGNVLDLAVAVIIGAAFGRIVTSLVNDLVMPLVGTLVGGINLTELKVVIKEAQGEVAELAITYGSFLQSIVDFLIIAFSIFLVVRWISALKKKEEEKPKEPPAPPREEVLLEEIRDLLKSGQTT